MGQPFLGIFFVDGVLYHGRAFVGDNLRQVKLQIRAAFRKEPFDVELDRAYIFDAWTGETASWWDGDDKKWIDEDLSVPD